MNGGQGQEGWGCRLAQGVIAREDVDESFFKAIPKEYTSMEIIYPVTLPPPTPCRMHVKIAVDSSPC